MHFWLREGGPWPPGGDSWPLWPPRQCVVEAMQLWQYLNTISVFLQSTLLQCLLGELETLEGSVSMNGRVSYASQDPWVFSGTVRENILFGFPYEKERYNTVIKACSLELVCKIMQ